jgi:hypothetical protein
MEDIASFKENGHLGQSRQLITIPALGVLFKLVPPADPCEQHHGSVEDWGAAEDSRDQVVR